MRARDIVATACAVVVLAPVGIAQGQVTPTLSATASGSGIVGDPQSDTATLSGSAMATGTITFSVFGPDDPTCSQSPASVSTVLVTGDGTYVSQSFSPDSLGTFRWVAAYDGDAQNAPVATACGDPAQSLESRQAHPTLATTASAAVAPGGSITDTARVSGAATDPTGSVTFTLYGPDDAACARAPAASSTITIDASAGEPHVTSSPYVAAAAGAYRWVAAYSGDARDLPASGACGDAGESVVVTDSVPPPDTRVSVRVPQSATVGGQIGATATLATPGFPTGRLTFRVYGPDDATCRRGAVAASTRTVFGNGSYSSDPFTPVEPGVYRVVADFDADGAGAIVSRCDDPAATVSVRGAPRPVLDDSFTVARVSGSVLVRVAGNAAGRTAAASGIGFVEVRSARTVPVGSTIDTRSGVARLTTATAGSALQSGVFEGSSFVVRQRATERGLVEIRLHPSGNARTSCPAQAPGKAYAARRKKLGKGVLAKLRARVRGRFRTQGKHSSASAHGTEWLTVERCDGTLTKVVSDVVSVRDFRLRRTILVHAGHSYLAAGAPGG